MLINARTGGVVAREVELADSRASRRKGLLGRDSLAPSSALILVPCFSIHTAFMRFPIDVVFVDRAGVVVRAVRHIGPWRAAASLRGHAVIEMAAGSLESIDLQVGDRLYLAAEPAPAGEAVTWAISA